MTVKRAEFHSHTVLTDGELLGIELIRRAVALGHRAIAVTDHVSLGNIEWIVRQEIADCELAKSWDIVAIPGVVAIMTDVVKVIGQSRPWSWSLLSPSLMLLPT